jgi:predicted solute-binding protein
MISILAGNAQRSTHLVDACALVFSEYDIKLDFEPQDRVDWRFREDLCGVALVPPLVYGSAGSGHLVIPGASVSAVGATGDSLLAFRQGVPDLRRIAYTPHPFLDLTLAGIVLKEKYGANPEFIETHGTLDGNLANFDAVLLDEAQLPVAGHDPVGTLDLVDEWFDMTQLPYVHAVFAGQETLVTPEIAEAVRRSGERADSKGLALLEEEMAGKLGPDDMHAMHAHYRFGMDADIVESIETLFRLAFFHGFHHDVPDLMIWTPPGPEQS